VARRFSAGIEGFTDDAFEIPGFGLTAANAAVKLEDSPETSSIA
jgi:hypothetical protein